jgi:hypothetical protein
MDLCSMISYSHREGSGGFLEYGRGNVHLNWTSKIGSWERSYQPRPTRLRSLHSLRVGGRLIIRDLFQGLQNPPSRASGSRLAELWGAEARPGDQRRSRIPVVPLAWIDLNERG